MNQQNLEEQAQQQTVKKKKSTAWTNAVLIGFMMGIVIYSALNNSLGFFTLIPLYIIYRLVNQSKKQKNTREG